MSPSLRRQLDDLCRRLGLEFSHEQAEAIAELVDAAFVRTADARVQQYRLVLAERHSRTVLRRRSSAAADGRPCT